MTDANIIGSPTWGSEQVNIAIGISIGAGLATAVGCVKSAASYMCKRRRERTRALLLHTHTHAGVPKNACGRNAHMF